MDNVKENEQLLLEGYWYRELPEIEELAVVCSNLTTVLNKIADGSYEGLHCDDQKFVCNFSLPEDKCPSYIHKGGVESITFFEFKTNGSYREMQLLNLKYYIVFIYNTMQMYESLFYKLYTQETYRELIDNSNSYILFDDHFYIERDYEGNEIDIAVGKFAVNNNKTTGQLAYERNSKKYLDKQSTYLFSVKVDVESFFPNIYTHYIERCGESEPFKSHFPQCKKYFEFLDFYNMKCNNNQTKGIAAGIFSSTIAAELLMLCVDAEINQLIEGKDVAFIRYVDDITFFSNSTDEINNLLPEVQRILNKYRLRINSEKTETSNCLNSTTYVDIASVKRVFDFEESTCLDKELFIYIKRYIAEKNEKKEYSELKAFLTFLKNAISNEQLKIIDDENTFEGGAVYLANLMMQLAMLNPIFTARCYRVIETVIEKYDKKEKIISKIQEKRNYVDRIFNNTMVQLWHYYLLGKYCNEGEEIIDSLNLVEVNPIILSFLVHKGNGTNRKLFTYVKNSYIKENNIDELHAEKWKESIMNSKWWLPIVIIFLRDGKNYDGFYKSGCFGDLFKDICKKDVANESGD